MEFHPVKGKGNQPDDEALPTCVREVRVRGITASFLQTNQSLIPWMYIQSDIFRLIGQLTRVF
jgi:hypothetical protein